MKWQFQNHIQKKLIIAKAYKQINSISSPMDVYEYFHEPQEELLLSKQLKKKR